MTIWLTNGPPAGFHRSTTFSTKREADRYAARYRRNWKRETRVVLAKKPRRHYIVYVRDDRATKNPGARRATTGGRTMARRTPARDPRTGRFLTKRQKAVRKGGGRKRKTTRRTTRRRSARSSAPRRRRSTRRRSNPPRLDVVGKITGGLLDAATLSIAEGVTRLVPSVFKLPTGGNVGLAVSLATAVGVGVVADYAMGADVGRLATAAALAVPLKTAAVRYIGPSVPMVAQAFQPLAAYSRPARRRAMSSYSRPALPAMNAALAGYDYAAGVF